MNKEIINYQELKYLIRLPQQIKNQ